MKKVAVIVACLCLVSRFVVPGWMTLFGAPFYLGASVAHVVVHLKALRPPLADVQVRLAVVSNCLLGVAFLLQLDFGEDYQWMTLTHFIQAYFYAHPGAEPFRHHLNSGVIALVDTALFVPVAVTWILMLKQRARAAQSPHSDPGGS